MKRLGLMRFLGLFLVLALVLAACGDAGGTDTTLDDSTTATTAAAGETTTSTAAGETTSTTTTTTTTTGEEPEPEPVRGISEDGVISLGTWIAQSGPLAVVANIANAMQLRFDIANEAGGVNGYTVDLTIIDDQANPSQTVNAVRELWENDEVFALIAPYGSGGLSAVKDYLVDNDVITIFPFGDSRILFAENPPPNSFGLVPFYSDAIDLLMETAQADGVETVAVLHTNDPLGEAGPEGAAMAAERLGMEVVETVGYDSTETNYAPLGRRLADSGADAILIWSFTGSVQVLQAALEAGYDGKILLHDGFRGGFFFDQLLTLPFDLNGRAYTNIWFAPTDAPEAAEYAEAFTNLYPDGDVNLGQSGWAASEVFLTAVEEATADGSPLTWEALREVFLGWENKQIGMVPAISYSETNRAGISQGKVRILENNEWVDTTDWTPYFRYR